MSRHLTKQHLQAKAQAATKDDNLVDVESERLKDVMPKTGSIELLGHEAGVAAGAAAGGHHPAEVPFLV